MLYMVVERFKNRDCEGGLSPLPGQGGAWLPTALAYVESWVEDELRPLLPVDGVRRWRALLEEWAAQWRDLVEFEFVPVRRSS